MTVLVSSIQTLACVSKLIQYLGKWLMKFERFPQAGPCPKGSSTLGLEQRL